MDLIDDHTNMMWSIPLKSKDIALPELKAWELAREASKSDCTMWTMGNSSLTKWQPG